MKIHARGGGGKSSTPITSISLFILVFPFNFATTCGGQDPLPPSCPRCYLSIIYRISQNAASLIGNRLAMVDGSSFPVMIPATRTID